MWLGNKQKFISNDVISWLVMRGMKIINLGSKRVTNATAIKITNFGSSMQWLAIHDD